MLLVRYKIFCGMTFGTVDYKGKTFVSYGANSKELINNLRGKISKKTGDGVRLMIGDKTYERLEDMVTVKRTKRMQWYFDRLGKVKEQQSNLEALPEEVTYEEKDGWLYVYKLKAVKEFVVKGE